MNRKSISAPAQRHQLLRRVTPSFMQPFLRVHAGAGTDGAGILRTHIGKWRARVGSAYVNHCPMAFKNRGADWLSPSPEILNPYFGSKMLTCGTVRRNLSFDPERIGQPSSDHQKHEHHKH